MFQAIKKLLGKVEESPPKKENPIPKAMRGTIIKRKTVSKVIDELINE